MEGGLCRLYYPSPPPGRPHQRPQVSHRSVFLYGEMILTCVWKGSRAGGQVYIGGGYVNLPAWETESPANSINWSSEKAPMDMRSLSSAAAFLADIVYESF